ncbi:uncharacterized protein LOC120731521 [Simochromis diagramma]|uniref:uncharacterized protein LOC120731521 n=1 Tax=Simochromis diagramma TaxID=43689 RepID=UPI001A7E884A|nr:uncharacterized protein LOC120731521 [Simochromis diagramma]
MAGHLLFVILIYFFDDIKAQAFNLPKVILSKSLITETDSVTLSCEAPSSISVSQCNFYIASQTVSTGSSCVQTLTGTMLLRMARKTLPAAVEVRCAYVAKRDGSYLTSLDSEPSTIAINALLPPKLKVRPQVITETDSVILDCETPPSVSISDCYFRTSGQQLAKKFSCLQKLNGSEMLSLAHQSAPVTLKVTCFYLYIYQSPMSNVSPLTIRSFLQPTLTVSRSAITEMDSVTLNCEAPSSVSECYFYTSSKGTVRKLSCLTQQTATELLEMAGVRPPAEIKVSCSYMPQTGGSNSFYSDSSSIIIKTPLPPKLIINPPVITETESVTLNCETPSSVSVPECYFYTLSGGTVKGFSCLTTLTATTLLEMANLRTPAEIKVICFYTAQPGELKSRNSSTSTITVQRGNIKNGKRTMVLVTIFPGDKTGMPITPTSEKHVSDRQHVYIPISSDNTHPMDPSPQDEKTGTLLITVIVVSCSGVAVAFIVMGFLLLYTQRRAE